MNCTWNKQRAIVGQIVLFAIVTVFLLALPRNAGFISEKHIGYYFPKPSRSTDVHRQVTLSDEERILMYGDVIRQERKNVTTRACAAMQSVYNQTQIKWNFWTKRKRPRLFYSQDRQILVCDTPKCGSTQWRNAILILDGLVNATTADELVKITDKSFDLSMARFMWKTINFTVAKGQDRANEMLNNYYKIMTVREPLERLVSAYKEKLEKGGNIHYTPISRNIHQRFAKHPVKGKLASFSEFVDFILSVKDPVALDVHWMRYTDLCDPCRMEYDYILKMETIYEDINYLTTKLGIDRSILFPDSKGEDLRKKWDSNYFLYYYQLTQAKRIAIFEYYKQQYDFFGYEYPEFITKSPDEQNKNQNTTAL